MFVPPRQADDLDAVRQALVLDEGLATTLLNAIWWRAPFDLAAPDEAGNTLLHTAIAALSITIPDDGDDETSGIRHDVPPGIAWLLEHGAPVDRRNKAGASVLDVARTWSVTHPGVMVAVEQALLAQAVDHDHPETLTANPHRRARL